MNFGGYIGAMTAISMINSHGYNECHEDADDEWTEEDIMTDGVKEVAYNPWVYTIVPNVVIKKYISNKDIVKEYLKLKKEKKYSHPLYYKKDMNLKRWIYIKEAYFNQIRKFKKYF